jgi:hypothetical protein
MARLFVSRIALPAVGTFVILTVLLVGSAAFAQDGTSDIVTVTNTADAGNGSLRWAIATANGGDTIAFDAALAEQTITLTSGELLVDKDLVIDGSDAPTLTVAANGASRVFFVAPKANVSIKTLRLRDGNGTGADSRYDNFGGCVYNNGGQLTLESVEVFKCEAEGGGGGIANIAGDWTCTDCYLHDNQVLNPQGQGGGAYSYGAGLAARATISASIVSTNTAGYGGGMINFGNGAPATMAVADTTVYANRATQAGGGLYNVAQPEPTTRRLAGLWASPAFLPPLPEGARFRQPSVFVREATMNTNRVLVTGNDGGENCGGLCNLGTMNTLNTAVTRNQATTGGGLGNADQFYGRFNTLAYNRAQNGAGLSVSDAFGLGQTTAVHSSILYNHVEVSQAGTAPAASLFENCYFEEDDISRSGSSGLDPTAPITEHNPIAIDWSVIDDLSCLEGASIQIGDNVFYLSDYLPPIVPTVPLSMWHEIYPDMNGLAHVYTPEGINGCGDDVVKDGLGNARPQDGDEGCTSGAMEGRWIKIKKVTKPPSDEEFDFTVLYGLPEGSPGRRGVAKLEGVSSNRVAVEIPNVPNINIQEVSKVEPGWFLDDIVCQPNLATIRIDLKENVVLIEDATQRTIECTFTNKNGTVHLPAIHKGR